MADRLVDLQCHLLRADDEVGGVEARAEGRGEQLARFLGDARRVREQVELAHELPAARAELPADAGIAAPLRLGLAVDVRLHGRAAFTDALVDAVAVGRGEPLRGVPDVVAGHRDVGAVLGHGLRGVDEQVALLGKRHAQRVLLDGVLPVIGPRFDRGQLEVRARDRRAGPSDRCGLRSRRSRGLEAEVGGREEAPPRSDQGPDTDPDRSFLGETFDLAVARVHRFVAPVHDPRVGVSGAGPQRGFDGRIGVFEHGERLARLTDRCPAPLSRCGRVPQRFHHRADAPHPRARPAPAR